MTVTVVVPADKSYDGTAHTYTDDADPLTGLDGGGHVYRMVPITKDMVSIADSAIAAAATAADMVSKVSTSASTNATSTSTLAVSTGSKTITLAETGKAYVVGQYVLIALTATPATNMVGQITAFLGTTLTVNVLFVSGSGSGSAWTVSITGKPMSANTGSPTNITGLLKGDGSSLGTVVSGTDIKTIGGNSVLGSGNIVHFDTSTSSSGQVLVSCGANETPVFQALPTGIGKWQSYTSTTTFTAPRKGTFRFYAFGKGGDGSGIANTSVTCGGGGGCAYGDIQMNAGQVATITISAAGQTKVTVGSIDMLIANAAVGTTAGSASKDAAVTNGGAFSGGTGATVSGATSAAVGATCGSPLGIGKNGVGTSVLNTAIVGQGVVANGGLGASGYSLGGRDLLNRYTDPLLAGCFFPCVGESNVSASMFGSDGGDGAGGSNCYSSGGNGGFMGGGGAALTSGSPGSGGFGSSGAVRCGQVSMGTSGYAAGGGAATTSGVVNQKSGGAAICLIYY